MLDQIKDKKLEDLNTNLAGINRKLGNMWFAFGKGLLSGLGSVLGAGLAIILIGWFLNVIGVIPALSDSAKEWREAFQATQQSANLIPSPATGTTATPVE